MKKSVLRLYEVVKPSGQYQTTFTNNVILVIYEWIDRNEFEKMNKPHLKKENMHSSKGSIPLAACAICKNIPSNLSSSAISTTCLKHYLISFSICLSFVLYFSPLSAFFHSFFEFIAGFRGKHFYFPAGKQ